MKVGHGGEPVRTVGSERAGQQEGRVTKIYILFSEWLMG
jgi:hypothetical protein